MQNKCVGQVRRRGHGGYISFPNPDSTFKSEKNPTQLQTRSKRFFHQSHDRFRQVPTSLGPLLGLWDITALQGFTI